MKTAGYRVIFQGIQPDHDVQVVKQALAEAFHSTPEKMELLLSKLPIVVKENVDRETALKYQEVILKAGGDCRLESPGETEGDFSAPAEPPPLKVCPKCGYQAVSPDDPLLTAYGGLGECPACGIILAKIKRDEAGPPGEAATEKNAKESEVFPGKTRRAFPIKMLLFGLVLSAVVVYFAMNREAHPPEKQSVKKTETNTASLPAEEGHARGDKVGIRIAPGEAKTFTISTYLPFLHEDTASPLPLKPLYEVLSNTWSARGVQAEVLGGTVTSHPITLWEFRHGGGNWNVVRAYHEMVVRQGWTIWVYRTMKSASEGTATPSKVPRLTGCSDIWSLKELDGVSREAIGKYVSKTAGGNPELRQTRYIMYRADLEVSIRLPEGGEFSAGASNPGKRDTPKGELQLKMPGLREEGGDVFDLSRLAFLELVQEAGKDGILVTVSSATPQWEIRK
jgi:hypothetical protein